MSEPWDRQDFDVALTACEADRDRYKRALEQIAEDVRADEAASIARTALSEEAET